MTCDWVCPDCEGQCGIDFDVLDDFDHEDFHQACDVAPEYGGTD